MSARRRWLQLLWLPCVTACQAPVPAPPSHGALVRAHLAYLVVDQQPPCGAVHEYTRHGRLDYRVVCTSGRVYRVQVSADGHVVVMPAEAVATPR